MSQQTNPHVLADEYATLKSQQKLLLTKIDGFRESFGKMVEEGKAFFSYSKQFEKEILNYNGFQIWAEYCDGNILIVNWKVDGPHKAELHVHEDSNEMIVVEGGEAILHLESQSIPLSKTQYRNIAYLKPKDIHSLEIISKDGAYGYAVLIPPDFGLVAKDNKCIYKNLFGTCHGHDNCRFSQ